MDELGKRLTEVDEILSYLSIEELLKIPAEVRKAIEENKDKEYIWKYDENKSLKEQNLNRDTIAYLSYLNMKYLLNDEEKNLMNDIFKFNDKKKKQKAGENNSFVEFLNEDKDINAVDMPKEINDESLVEYKENIFTKLFKKIKSIFTKK